MHMYVCMYVSIYACIDIETGKDTEVDVDMAADTNTVLYLHRDLTTSKYRYTDR